jgi:Uma2 family endonuclease
MGETGILRPDARVELIQGEIIDMAPIGSHHSGTVNLLTALITRSFGERIVLAVQNPLTLDERSEPQPDLTVLRARADYYRDGHPAPGDTLLVIEVAENSLRYDMKIKLPLYAARAIPEVWIVDLDGQRLARYSEPGEQGYRVCELRADLAAVELTQLPGTRLDLHQLFDD